MTRGQQGQEQPVKPHHTDVYFVHSAFTFPAFVRHFLKEFFFSLFCALVKQEEAHVDI